MFKKKKNEPFETFRFGNSPIFTTNNPSVKAVAKSAEEETRAKSEKICTLCGQIDSLKEENAKLKGTESQLKKANAELERFYLREIGRCETVKQVKHVVEEYNKLDLNGIMESIARAVMEPKEYIIGSRDVSTLINTAIHHAATTKIKRINKKNIMWVCQNLDNETNKMEYARIMMNELKETAEIEADGKKIIDARKSGMDAWGVFLSMLAEYKVRRDSVF